MAYGLKVSSCHPLTNHSVPTDCGQRGFATNHGLAVELGKYTNLIKRNYGLPMQLYIVESFEITCQKYDLYLNPFH